MPTTTPCETCGHAAADHSDLVGCTVEDGTGYCTCETYKGAPRRVTYPSPNVLNGLAEGRQARDEGAALAGTGSPGVLADEWRRKADDALDALAKSGETFSADDLVERVGMPPVPNMLGGVFLAARRANRIEAVGFAQATRAASHARVQRTWKGSL
jgi:hypothetical protein